MTAVYAVLIIAGLLANVVGIVGLVDTVAEILHPLPPAIPLVPFDAPEDQQPTLGVLVSVAQRAMREARERAADDAQWVGAR